MPRCGTYVFPMERQSTQVFNGYFMVQMEPQRPIAEATRYLIEWAQSGTPGVAPVRYLER
jgi:hypothetical protein